MLRSLSTKLQALLPRRYATKTSSAFPIDGIDLLTGIQKREMLAYLAGDCDPFRMLAIKKGPGTRQCPNLVPSAFDKRLIACVCHPDNMQAVYLWIHMGEPKRCMCGYWFELCPVAPL